MHDELMARLFKARSGLVLASPFFGSLALHLDMKVDEKSKAAFWTDGRTLGVNPEAVRELELPELEGMIARAVLNSAFGHVFRRGGREAKRWSAAAAHVANLEVLAAGMMLPKGSPADARFKGMTAEQAYAMLAPAPSEEPEEGGGKPQSGQGEPQAGGHGKEPGKPGGAPQSAPSTPKGKPEKGSQSAPGAGEGQGQAEAGKTAPAGSGEAGEPDFEPGSGEVRDAPGDEASIEEQAGDWQEKLAQATQLARAAGKLPGDLERAAMKVVDARVPWHEALFRYFKSRAKDDHSWMSPARRYLPLGLYMPSMQSTRLGTVAIFLDLSGSIQQKWIDAFLSEMEAIRDECKPESIVLVPFDSSVRRGEVREFAEFDPLEFKARGGGGTDFRVGPAFLAEQGIRPEVAVYLTDLDCGSFADEPEYPVLWVSTLKEKAPYGEVIRLAI